MTSNGTSADVAPLNSRPMFFTAFFGALALTGLGQIFTGYTRRGLLWLVATIVMSVLAVATIMLRMPTVVVFAGVAAAVGLRLVAIVDALRCGRRPRRAWGRWWSRGLVVAAAFALMMYLTPWPIRLLHDFIEAYSVETNAMLPTIAGRNVSGVCTKCHSTVSLIPPEPGQHVPANDLFADARGLCPHCGTFLNHSAYVNEKSTIRNGDRLLVSKWLMPRRWDIIAFDCPDEPGAIYAKRLVGLPGERVELVEGVLTIDGQEISPPEFLSYLHYIDMPKLPELGDCGQHGNPAVLGPDEYFVLGDFSPALPRLSTMATRNGQPPCLCRPARVDYRSGDAHLLACAPLATFRAHRGVQF